jgi:hypothetical protein
MGYERVSYRSAAKLQAEVCNLRLAEFSNLRSWQPRRGRTEAELKKLRHKGEVFTLCSWAASARRPGAELKKLRHKRLVEEGCNLRMRV